MKRMMYAFQLIFVSKGGRQIMNDAEKRAMRYPLNEIFYSIQGEGYWTGTPMVFVRFAGCNYECSWCDTNFSKNWSIDPDGLAEQIGRLSPKLPPRICLTGGEPCLHKLKPLLDRLWQPAFHIETNGSLDHEAYIDRAWITISPKKPDGQPVTEGTWRGHELKLIDQGQDLSRFTLIAPDGCSPHYYLQPCWSDDPTELFLNTNRTVERVKERPWWRLSIQTQKYLKLR
jgi:organic radical activating enzyme